MELELKHLFIFLGVLVGLVVLSILVSYLTESKSEADILDEETSEPSFSRLVSIYKKFESFSKHVKENYSAVQKIFVVLLILNFTVGVFYLFTHKVYGSHIKELKVGEPGDDDFRPEKLSDVLIGFAQNGEINIPTDEEPYPFRTVAIDSYSDFGLTYQELLISLFIGLILLFCLKIF